MAATTYQGRPYLPNTSAPLAAPIAENSPLQQLGFNVLLVFIFLAFSRIFDVKFGGLHITGISYRLVLIMTVLTGGVQVALKSGIGKALLGFTICFGISVPFSIWRTGSKDIFLNTWLTFSLVGYLAVAGLIGNYKDWFKLFKVLAFAVLVFAIIAVVFGVSDNGRLFLEQGKFSNPNEMAQALLLGLPLWGAIAMISKSLPAKAIAAVVMLLILATTFRTGSRGAMIGFVVTLLVVFLRAPIIGKLQIMVAGVLFLGLVMTTMPGNLIARYRSVAQDEVDVEQMGWEMADSATASTQSRKTLLKHSLLFTMQHPLSGVGPGMFEVADDAYSKDLGMRKGTWVGTHNSYTQVSSELGIPAFLFFVTALVLSLKGTYSIYKTTRSDPRLEDMGKAALAFHYSLVIYAVTIFFDHIAYSVMLPVFAGMAAALVRTAQVEIQRIQSVPLPVTMSAETFHSYLATRSR